MPRGKATVPQQTVKHIMSPDNTYTRTHHRRSEAPDMPLGCEMP